MKYLIHPLKHMLDCQGRSNRKEIWLYFLWLAVCYIAFFFVAVFSTVAAGEMSCAGCGQGAGWIGILLCILAVWIGGILLPLGILTRRLHDLNLSGWWQLLRFIPSLGTLVTIIFMLLPGQVGENRFGPEPQDL